MVSLGSCLLQDGKSVVFASQVLTPPGERYDNVERQLLHLVFCLGSSILVWEAVCTLQ